MPHWITEGPPARLSVPLQDRLGGRGTERGGVLETRTSRTLVSVSAACFDRHSEWFSSRKVSTSSCFSVALSKNKNWRIFQDTWCQRILEPFQSRHSKVTTATPSGCSCSGSGAVLTCCHSASRRSPINGKRLLQMEAFPLLDLSDIC